MGRALAALLVLILGAMGLLIPYKGQAKVTLSGTILKEPKPAPDFTLYTAGGRPFSMHELRGQVVLLFFGYTHCPDICPMTMYQLAQIYKALGRPKDLKVLMITVDPERDDPDTTDRYAKLFDPDFIGLSGSPEAIAEVAAKYYVYSKRDERGFIDHTSTVTLVDSRGMIRIYYGQKDLEKIDVVVEDLRYILANGGSF